MKEGLLDDRLGVSSRREHEETGHVIDELEDSP
jgi:hypothetical protein